MATCGLAFNFTLLESGLDIGYLDMIFLKTEKNDNKFDNLIILGSL